jgi:hypothetical protein
MDNEEQVEDTLVTQEEVVEESEEVDWKAEAEKQKQIAENQKIRAEKAEKKAKEKPEQVDTLSAVDLIAVSKAGIEPEDIEEVIDYAKFKGVPIHEALKSSVVRATLAEKAELRKSAEATNTGSARRASSVVSDEQLVENARQGSLPESDADLRRLTQLRLNR